MAGPARPGMSCMSSAENRRSRVLLEVCMTKKSQIPAQRAPVSNSPGRGQRREDTRAARQAVEVSEGTTGGIEAIS